MGRGPVLFALGILALSIAMASPAAGAEGDRLLVNEDRLEQGEPSVVHAVVDLPPAWNQGVVEVQIDIEGPGSGAELVERRTGVQGGGTHLISTVWTPKQAGSHTLQADAVVGDEVRSLDEQRTVFVPAASSQESEAGVLPETAPGTVQWAIAFSVLFFFARIGLERRPDR